MKNLFRLPYRLPYWLMGGVGVCASLLLSVLFFSVMALTVMSLTVMSLSVVNAQDAPSGGGSNAGSGGSAGVQTTGNYTSTKQPVVIDQPSQEFLDAADQTTNRDSTTYDGTDHYTLHQGVRKDDKLAWAATDYIRWEAQAATLRASGRCHDGDPKNATRVSSKAWGAQLVVTRIGAEEGDRGEITAENRIGFGYAYDISGGRILEATVQLTGEAVDIKGAHHRFNVSDTRSESIREQKFHSQIRQIAAQGGGSATVGVSRTGPAASASVETSYAVAATEKIDVTITRRLADAGSDAGGASGPLVIDIVAGPTPLEAEHRIFSAAGVVLSARGDTSDGGGPVIVVLEKFIVQNTLRVFAIAERGPDDPEPPPPPPGSDPTAPGGPTSGTPSGSNGGSPNGDGGPDEGSPGEGSTTELGPEPEDDFDDSEETMSLDDLPGLEGRSVTARVKAPFGRLGEQGGTDGQLNLILSEPAPRDLVFAVSIEPEGAVLFPRGATLTIREGELSTGGPIGKGVGAEAIFFLHLLSGAGERSGYELSVRAELVSTSSRLEPVLYACAETEAALPGASTMLSGIKGGRTPDLLIGRSGFDGFDEVATTFTLELDDPEGVLPPLPSTVSIGPGEREVRISIELQNVEGGATIHLRSGTQSLDVVVRSHKQRWAAPPTIRIPLGAIAPVPYRLLWSEIDSRPVVSAVEQGGPLPLAIVEEGAEFDFIPAGATLWAVPVKGLSIGTSSVRIESEGMDPLIVPIEIVPARVSLVESQLRLANLPIGTSGAISIRSVSGQKFVRLDVPVDLQDNVVVVGLGTDQIVVHLTATPNLPALLALAIEMAAPDSGGSTTGESTSGNRFDVDEVLLEDGLQRFRNNYQIEWR